MNRRSFDVRWVLAPLLLAVAVACFAYALNMKTTNIVVEGNDIYTEDEVAKLVFPEENDTYLWKVWMKYSILKQQNSIPFVQKYSVDILGFDTVKITVYEKQIIGCFAYMSNYMYFDRDGIIVDSLGSLQEGIPLVEGFTFDQIVMHEQLPVENTDIFNEILNLTQLLSKSTVSVAKVSFDTDMNITLYLGEPEDQVKVYMGDSDSMADKLALLEGMVGELEGKCGTLYLDNSYAGVAGATYIFKPDKETE